MLSGDPGQNQLWILVKANVAPMLSLKLRQFGRWVGDLASGAYAAVASGVRAVGGVQTE